MKEHLSTLGSPVVLCHNDLLCKNIIHNSKEGNTQRQPVQFHIAQLMVLMVYLRNVLAKTQRSPLISWRR